MRRASLRRCAGFTLLELVVGLVISTIVIGFAASLMTTPVDAYYSQTRRSDLVERSGSITRTLQRDLSMAVPNSVRIRNLGSRAIVELMIAERTTFYRPNGTFGAPDRELNLTAVDSVLAVFGPIEPLEVQNNYDYPAHYLVVNNEGEGSNDAYRLQDVITPTPVTLRIARDPVTYATSGEERLTFAPAFYFRNNPMNPTRRMFLVSGPVAYICNSGTGTLRRYDNYAITNGIPADESAAQLIASGVRNTVIATDVSACSFTCPGTTNAAPRCIKALNVALGLSRSTGNKTDATSLYQQFPVDNIP
jgi:MSHA biogenesis protein MshO